MRLALAVLLALTGAAGAEVNQAAILAPKPPKLLSDFAFFAPDGTPAPGVVPYTIASPLFSDYADKDRYIVTPAPAAYQTEGVLDFPVGAALVKTFRFGIRKIETRVLLHQDAGWKAYSYQWDEAGTEAELKIAGADLVVPSDHGDVAWHIPNVNQCKACHVDNSKAFLPIGPKVRNLNTGDQLDRLVAAGVLAETHPDAPATGDYRDASLPLDQRARAFLDANCGHCHAPGRPADTSGLFLHWDETDPERLGVMKPPVAAGRGSGTLKYDIVPGKPEESILLYRIRSTDPGVMMPEIGRSLVYDDGAALVEHWIAGMED